MQLAFVRQKDGAVLQRDWRTGELFWSKHHLSENTVIKVDATNLGGLSLERIVAKESIARNSIIGALLIMEPSIREKLTDIDYVDYNSIEQSIHAH